MYWFRGRASLYSLPWLMVTAAWLLGGWLIATHAFRLEKRERLLVGAASGLAAYLWLVNLVGHWLPAEWAFTIAGLLVLLIGFGFAWKSGQPLVDWQDLKAWPSILALLALVWVFTRIAMGTTLFDEWKNLSIISTMAAGDIPPHFYMNSDFYFAYHYAFQLFGASMMRLGNLLPWSAFDLSKAITGAISILLVYLVGRRMIKHPLGGISLAGVLTFAGGTRYLMLILPSSFLARIDAAVAFTHLDLPVSQALLTPWAGDPGTPITFPIAFLNGILSWPRFMSIQAGPSTLAFILFLLTWLTYNRIERRGAYLLIAMNFALWALSWEATYALFLVGSVLAASAKWLQTRKLRDIHPLLYVLWLSFPIAALQGGTLTEVFRQVLTGAASNLTGSPATGIAGFSLRWPPAIPSSQFNDLSLGSPIQLLVAFLEIGPVILFAPWITIWAWKRFKGGDWMHGILLASAWVGFLMPIFLVYKTDRDIPRLMAYSIEVWVLFLVMLLFDTEWKKPTVMSQSGIAALSVMVFSGLVIAGISLTYAPHVVFGRSLNHLDTYIASEYWDKLEPGSKIFDPRQWRATALTGRLTQAALSTNQPAPAWEALRDDPRLKDLLSQGYSYVYVDEGWWRSLPQEKKAGLKQPCVKTLSEYDNIKLEFRRLLDLTACKP